LTLRRDHPFPGRVMTPLPRIRAGLLKHPLDKQVLVYDTITDRVHLLDPTTACVLELLEEGTLTSEGISEQIVARLDLAPDPGFLPLAIEELRRADLLDQSTGMQPPLIDRRELLQKVALTGVAALLIPTVASLTAIRGYAQGTAPNQGVCNTCTDSSQCINSQCCNGMCMVACIGNGTGACCTLPGQCASGVCTGGFCAAPVLIANGQPCNPPGGSGANSSCASGFCADASAGTTTAPFRCCHPNATNDNRLGGAGCNNDNQCCSGSCPGTGGGRTCTAV